MMKMSRFYNKTNDGYCSPSVQIRCPSPPKTTISYPLINADKMNPVGNTQVWRISQILALWNDTRQPTLSHRYQHFNSFSDSPNALSYFLYNNCPHSGQPERKIVAWERGTLIPGSATNWLGELEQIPPSLGASISLTPKRDSWTKKTPQVSSISKNLTAGGHKGNQDSSPITDCFEIT